MYLEGSDQHRGWFHSSLLESCGTRGRAPYDVVLTHGFTLDEQGRKMSKSLGNTIEPQNVIKESGADILRLWVCATDYADDQRVGPEILKNTVESYRKLRNTIRWMLGTLHHARPNDMVAFEDMPELERLMLHRACRTRCRGAAGLCRLRLQDRGRERCRVHERRAQRVLLRYPQRRAVLRSAVVARPQGGADHGRHPVRHHPEMARAGVELHLRRSLDQSKRQRRSLGPPDDVPDRPRALPGRRAGEEMGQDPRRPPRRHRRARDRTRGETHRLVARSRRRSSTSPIARCLACSPISTLPKSASPRTTRCRRTRRRPARSR